MTTATKAKRETWRDWMPGEPPDGMVIMSRDELLDALRDRGIDITPRTLERWQAAGALPYPVRRWHEDAVKATYPGWLVPAIAHLRELQDQSVPVARIAQHMRAWAFSAYDWKDPLADVEKAARIALTAYVRAWEAFAGKQIGGVEVTFNTGDGHELWHWGFPVVPESESRK